MPRLASHPERGISDHSAAPWTDSGQIVADSEVKVKQPPPGRLIGSPVSAFGCPETVAASRSSIMWRGTFYAVENICTHQGGSLGIR